MSRDLPTHPDLDHLKRQAKVLLRKLRRQRSDFKLADAQHTLALEYGFASWPKLKAHVESLQSAANPPDFGFERYTPKARQALFFSRYEAWDRGSVLIEPEHILLGLIRAGEGLRSQIFERANLSLERARADVATPSVAHERTPSSVEIPFGKHTKRILLYATEEADRLRHQDVGIAHLMLGLLRHGRSIAASILGDRGISLQAIRDDIPHLLDERPM